MSRRYIFGVFARLSERDDSISRGTAVEVAQSLRTKVNAGFRTTIENHHLARSHYI